MNIDIRTTNTNTTVVTTSEETSLPTEATIQIKTNNKDESNNDSRYIGLRTKYARDLGNQTL